MDSPPPYQEYSSDANSFNPGHLPETFTCKKSSVPFRESLSVNNGDRKAWLCPHLGLDFKQAKGLFSTIPVSNPPCSGTAIEVCKRSSCNTNLGQRVRKYQNERGNLSHELMSGVKLFRSSTSRQPQGAEGIFSLDQISTALQGLDFPICGHLRLNQSFILSRFNSKCMYPLSHGKGGPCTCYRSELRGSTSQSQSPFVRKTCKNRVNCAACHEQGVSTKFTLLMKEYIDETGQQMVLLSVCFLRGLGSLDNADELAWLTSTVKPRELHYMASIWQDWEAHILKLRVRWFGSFNSSRDSVKPSTTAPPVKNVMRYSKISKRHFSLANIASTLKQSTQNAKRYLQNLGDFSWVRSS